MLVRGLIAVMAMATLLAGCRQEQPEYGCFRPTPLRGWASGDTLTFTVALPPDTLSSDTRHSYSLLLCLRSDRRYTRTGVMLRVEQRLDTVSRRRVAFPMSDDYGRSYGSGIAVNQHCRHLADVSMSQKDTLHVYVTPDTAPGDTLHGITDVGLLLTDNTTNTETKHITQKTQ